MPQNPPTAPDEVLVSRSLQLFAALTHPLPMSSINILRLATRTRSPKLFRPQQAARQLPSPASVGCNCFSTSVRRAVDKDGQEAADHHEESFEQFTARYAEHWTGGLVHGHTGKPQSDRNSRRPFE